MCHRHHPHLTTDPSVCREKLFQNTTRPRLYHLLITHSAQLSSGSTATLMTGTRQAPTGVSRHPGLCISGWQPWDDCGDCSNQWHSHSVTVSQCHVTVTPTCVQHVTCSSPVITAPGHKSQTTDTSDSHYRRINHPNGSLSSIQTDRKAKQSRLTMFYWTYLSGKELKVETDHNFMGQTGVCLHRAGAAR